MLHRRFQFRLGVLLTTIGVFSVLLAVGYWFGWRILYQLLFFTDCLGALGVTLLPVEILVFGRSPQGREQIGTVILIAGSFLVLHSAVLALSVEYLLREPFELDLSPFDSIISVTLNWTVPSAAAGLLISLAFRTWKSRSLFYWIGTALTTGACAALIWYGYYFFSLVGTSLVENVWWL